MHINKMRGHELANANVNRPLLKDLNRSLLTVTHTCAVSALHFARYACVSKEAYISGKRDLFTWQERPRSISIPELCVSVKRDLLMWQKRPTNTLVYLRVVGTPFRGFCQRNYGVAERAAKCFYHLRVET